METDYNKRIYFTWKQTTIKRFKILHISCCLILNNFHHNKMSNKHRTRKTSKHIILDPATSKFSKNTNTTVNLVALTPHCNGYYIVDCTLSFSCTTTVIQLFWHVICLNIPNSFPLFISCMFFFNFLWTSVKGILTN